MEQNTSLTISKRYYIWIILFATIGILFSFYLLKETGREPPVLVIVLSAMGTGITGGLLGGVISVGIANYFSKQKVNRKEV